MKSRKIFVAFAILTIFAGYQCGKNVNIPEDLIGMWKSSAPKYSECFFELTENTIILGTREKTITTHAITNIKTEKISEEKSILYAISYTNQEGQKYKLSFYYDPANGGVIRFKNQQNIVWTKR